MEIQKELKQKWYKDKYALIFIIIMLLAVAIRIYYFWITQNSPLWWDEADYMSAAKTYAGQGFADLTGQRTPGLPLVASAFFASGIQNEAFIKFFICFIPSIIMLWALYLLVCKMYADKRIALISTAIMAVLWESLFYSNRFQTENFGLIFEFISLMCMYNFLNKDNTQKNYFWLGCVAAFAMLSIFFRPGQMLFIPAVVLFLLITQWKEHKIVVISSVIAMVIAFAGIMLFIPSINYIIMSNFNTNNLGPAWNSLEVFTGLFHPYLDILFYIGFVVCFANLFKKNNNKSDLFNLLLILAVMFAFIFVIRAPAFEYRWFFPLIIGALVFIARGITDIADLVGTTLKSKTFSAVCIIVIILLGVAGQVGHADSIIKNKIGTYADVKSASLWMKENSAPQDILSSISYTQTAYYSERKVMSYAELNNGNQFDEFLIKNKIRWFTISLYEPHPNWIYDWLNDNQQETYMAAAWFLDKEQTKPSLIIYGLLKDVQQPEETCSEDDVR